MTTALFCNLAVAVVLSAVGMLFARPVLQLMNTPAATIVAAWIRAETGVGPSMASGSHTCSGNWADLPTAPQNRHSTVMFSRVSLMPAGISIRLKLSVLVSAQRVRMPIRKPKSPTRLQMKAFLAASAAADLVYQWPMSR